MKQTNDSKQIVITSINPPTKAVYAYSKLENYHTIVVGDSKSPTNWHCKNIEFLSIESQATLPFDCEKKLPTNHYSRKNVGYLKAIQNGAKIIVDTDDDNIPYENYGHPSFEGIYETAETKEIWVNVYKHFTNVDIWPRGFPLDHIRDEIGPLKRHQIRTSVWQGLTNNDPDVDAIFRLTRPGEIIFNDRNPLVLKGSQICPINSQNTTFAEEAFPLLYLPTTVTFRFTDILRGLIMQPILSFEGKFIGFHAATVYQERNTHDLIADFESEIPCYLLAKRVPEIVKASISKDNSIIENLRNSYKSLYSHNIVEESELDCLDAWLSDLGNLQTY
jgi:hypothetical protein